MPEKETLKRAHKAAREGKSPSTQAGEFVHEEIEHIRKGKHGARSTQQAIAIGLSKARRAGVELPPPGAGKATEKTRRRAERDYEKGQSGNAAPTSATRSKSVRAALKREGSEAASGKALSRQASASAHRRSASARKAAARKAAQTKGSTGRKEAARKAARTRAARSRKHPAG